ncbi:MAG: hypothetical protein IKY48_04510 [Bacteroidales bacterium]|nr:hypothetical protein [Bacteroidales bacterium]
MADLHCCMAAADCATATNKVADTEAKINNLKKQISSLSLLQMSKKRELKEECEVLEMNLRLYEMNIDAANGRKRAIEALLPDAEAIKLDVDTYKAHLKSIVDKFRAH